MARPGYQFNITSTPPARSFPTNTGTAFLVAGSLIGRTDKAVLCRNLSDVVKAFGGRTNKSLMYDAADVAFRSGVSDMWVGRRVGPGATAATLTLKDGEGADSVTVTSIGAGTSTLKVAVVVGAIANSVILQVTDSADGDALVEQSPSVLTVADLVSWADLNAETITVAAVGADPELPVALAATALAGGDADLGNLDDADLPDDLSRLFPPQLGPGQVLAPGLTTTAAQVALLNHARDTNRFALLDSADISDVSTLIGAAQAVQAGVDLQTIAETYGMFWAPWRVVPGITKLTTRKVPSSAVVAGLIAASDAATGNPNTAAAGAQGIDQVSVSSSQKEWTDPQREQLNDAGINVFHLVGDTTQRAYGWRTLAITDGSDDTSEAWLSAGAARLRMAIVAELGAVAEAYLFTQLDGQGQRIASFGGAITGVLANYWQRGALYGATSADAFRVDVGPGVNTPVTLANNELHANIGIKVSPFAEMIYFDINKVALTGTV